ncbi:helix-turn-helix domain-containing protein [Fibrobacter sp.]|uniref:AlbA family DNA-binding domain-containing protein n=2 Tax=Fibrobacter sp. TaxID=35828 RepID=UPI0025BB2DBF|nr:ATP-binding protein [Fibrobacter sp.]MCI6436203.1 ATP-binding protein [Fibrobacter sp.]
MTQFEFGKVYEFQVVGLHTNGVGTNFLLLRYGNDEGFRVRALPFQVEGALPKVVRCRIKSISQSGLPSLEQDLAGLLRDNFVEGEEYSFSVISCEKDNNERSYYNVRDQFGLSHRYYYRGEPKYNIGESVELKVREIETEKARLKLTDALVVPSLGAPASVTRKTPVFAETEFGHEDLHTEFKTSIVYVPGESVANIDKQCYNIVKELAAFMNAEGGKLYIGINDSGLITGINDDFQHLNEGSNDYDDYPDSYKMNTDHYALKIQNVVKKCCNHTANACLDFNFQQKEGLIYCVVTVKPCETPIFVNGHLLYQRAGSQKQLLENDEITNFIRTRLGLNNKIQELINALEKNKTDEPKNNFEVTVSPQAVPVQEDDGVWNYFTWYKNGDWSFQKKMVDSEDVECQIDILKSKKDGVLVLCYDNGCINLIKPSLARAKKETGRRYKNGWNTKAKIMNVFVSSVNHLIAVFSKDIHGIEYAKLHRLSDFNPVASIGAQGCIIANSKFGRVQSYKWVCYDKRMMVPNLLLTKSQTSSTLGIPIKSAYVAGEMAALKDM